MIPGLDNFCAYLHKEEIFGFFHRINGPRASPQNRPGAHPQHYWSAASYGSLYAASRKLGESGKWTAAQLPKDREFDPLAEMLGLGVISILHASTFKPGSGKPDNLMQWANSGFLPVHGYTTGVIINQRLNEILQSLHDVMKTSHRQKLARTIGRVICHPYMFSSWVFSKTR